MLQIPISVYVRQVVLLFPNLVHFPKIGDNDVTAGGKNDYRKNDFIFGFLSFEMLQIPILLSVRQVVLLFLNLVHFPEIGDNDVTAGVQNLKISRN